MTRAPGLHVDRRQLIRRLASEHRELDAAFAVLFASSPPGPLRTLVVAWESFIQAVDEHFVVEETLLFPEYAGHEAAVAHELRAHHDSVRQVLGRSRLEADQGVLPAALIDEIGSRLRRCANREEATVYVWALATSPEGGGRDDASTRRS